MLLTMGDREEQLLRRIEALELENSQLRKGLFDPRGEATVIVPEPLKAQFEASQKTVGEYFQEVNAEPARGIIEVSDERYLLVRASGLSIDFFDTVRQLYSDRGEEEAAAIGRRVLFDIAHTMGINDARKFSERMKVTDPLDKLSAGPVHFAYTGWARVDIKPESAPSPDDDFYLIYDHPYSFEAASWNRAARVSTSPVCIMNAGYSSGWCQESFGVNLVSVEFSCRAMGDPHCRFVMAPPGRIAEHLEQLAAKQTVDDTRLAHIAIPEFFESKRLEEELAQAHDQLERRVEQRTEQLSTVNASLKKEIGERKRLEHKLREGAETNRALASQVVAAQEAERQRVAYELHDSIGQVLVALRMDAEWIAEHANAGDIGPRARDLQTHLSDILDAVRTVVHDLRPPVLDDLGIVSALESVAAEVRKRHDIRCDTNISIRCERVATEVATAVYRIAQEALNNVTRHSGADQATIALRCEAGGLALTVRDDGCGFDAQTAQKQAAEAKTTLGLVSMRQRAGLLGGNLSIESSQGGGTTLNVWLPCCPDL